MMRLHPATILALVAVELFWPVTVFAKRAAPKPVAPVVWEGVEYRASGMAQVRAVEITTGRKLWETKVYHVWIIPLAETDVQSVFITNLKVEAGKLVVKNEAGKTYQLDLKTGRVAGRPPPWALWVLLASAVFFVAKMVWSVRPVRSANADSTAG
jgi:outer membrane protein assembly factor BamB